MPSFKPGSGFTGTPEVSNWADEQNALKSFRDAAGGASLMLWPEGGQMGVFLDPPNGDGMVYEKLADYATVTRASKAWHPNWNFVSGAVVGQLIEYANNVPVLGPGGLLVSNQVENLIPNPRGEGAAAPAIPTGWTVTPGAGGTFTILGRGGQNGWPYVDIQVNGTTTETSYIYFHTETAVAGEVFCASVGLALLSGSTSGQLMWRIDAPTSVSPLTVIPDRVHRRFWVSGTLPSGSNRARPVLALPPASYANAVYRIYTPQLTKTAFPTPPVLPPAGTPGATVKQIDSVQIPASGWVRGDEGTIVIEYLQPPRRELTAPPGPALFRLGDAAVQNQGRGIEIYSTTGQLRHWGRQPTLIRQNVSATIPAVGSRNLVAISWSGTAQRAALNGAVTATMTTEAISTASHLLFFGAGEGGANYNTALLPSAIMRLRFFPRVMLDAELAAMTTPYWS